MDALTRGNIKNKKSLTLWPDSAPCDRHRGVTAALLPPTPVAARADRFRQKGGEMPGDDCLVRPLFGGAITSFFPPRFQDVSNIRQVPDHQEVFVDPSRDESLIFELLDLKHEVGDDGSAVWFLRDIANEQDAAETMVLEHSGTLEVVGLGYEGGPTIVATAVGQMAISKGRQGREAQNIVRVYLANLRLKEVSSDVLITAYEPILINPLSESARTVGAGPAVPAAQSGCLPVSEVFKLAVTNFKVHDWSLFGSGA